GGGRAGILLLDALIDAESFSAFVEMILENRRRRQQRIRHVWRAGGILEIRDHAHVGNGSILPGVGIVFRLGLAIPRLGEDEQSIGLALRIEKKVSGTGDDRRRP